MDPDEGPEICAIRELKEETGYTGVVKHISPGNKKKVDIAALYIYCKQVQYTLANSVGPDELPQKVTFHQ